MPFKDKAKQKAYHAAWLQRTYVPHPRKPAMTDEERKAKHKEHRLKRRSPRRELVSSRRRRGPNAHAVRRVYKRV